MANLVKSLSFTTRPPGTSFRRRAFAHWGGTRRMEMRKLCIGLLTAAGVAISAPASAQDVYVGVGSPTVGVEVAAGPYAPGPYYGPGPAYGYDAYAYAPGYRTGPTVGVA